MGLIKNLFGKETLSKESNVSDISPKEENNVELVDEINNIEYRESLGNGAISLLMKKGILAQNDLEGTTVDFGYIVSHIENGVDALLKLLNNGNEYYFAFQSGELACLNEDFSQHHYNILIQGINDSLYPEDDE